MTLVGKIVQAGLGPLVTVGTLGLLGAFLPARLVSATSPPPAPVSSTWTNLAPATSPPARFAAAMTYDAATGTVVMFGGSPNDSLTAQSYGDTWTWDGTSWTSATPPSPANSPAPRAGARLVYDAVHRQ